MSLTYLTQFPIHNISLNSIPLLFLILGLIEFLFFHIVLYWVRRNTIFFSKSEPSVQTQLCSSHDSKVEVRKENQDYGSDLNREEVEMVMGNLGIFCHPEGGKIHEKYEVCNLFDEKEPGLDEVKEAFEVFDENRDGFIDARELQRVVCALGLKDGSEMENCRRMIKVFDENGDGRIDFNEFVKLLETNFC